MPIQSVTDVITNSSSELFCVIKGQESVLEQIEEYLRDLIPERERYGDDDEISMTLSNDYCVGEDEEGKDIYITAILIDLPYSMYSAGSFMKEALPVLLREKFGDCLQYDLDFENNY